jgi:hypothetical protein
MAVNNTTYYESSSIRIGAPGGTVDASGSIHAPTLPGVGFHEKPG